MCFCFDYVNLAWLIKVQSFFKILLWNIWVFWLQKKTAAFGGLHNSFADHASFFREQLILVLSKCGCGLKLDNDFFVEELAEELEDPIFNGFLNVLNVEKAEKIGNMLKIDFRRQIDVCVLMASGMVMY